MEIIYAALLLHKSGNAINEGNLKKVLDAAGTKVDEAQIKALVASLEGVDIEKAITEASIAPAAAPAAAPEQKKEEKKEEKKDDSQAAAGLGALFG